MCYNFKTIMKEIRQILEELKNKGIKKQFFTLNEFSQILGISPETSKKLIDTHTILGIKHFSPRLNKFVYSIPVWAFKRILSEESYKIFLEELKKIYDQKDKNKTLFLKTIEIARFLNISVNTVIRLIKENKLEAIEIRIPNSKKKKYLIPVWEVKRKFFKTDEDYQNFLSIWEETLKNV